MKRFILISVLFAITAMAWAQQPAIGKCESKEGFTFFQVTDPQLGFHSKDKNLQWTIVNLKAMVSIINREHPAFVIITGDMIHRHYKKNQVEAYRSVIATVEKDIPVFHIPGNHDMPKYADAPRIIAKTKCAKIENETSKTSLFFASFFLLASGFVKCKLNAD